MPQLFLELRERLLREGVAPRHVRRYLDELADHLADLVAEETRAGRSQADAESAALVRLGNKDDLARAMTEKREFQSWCSRAPWAAFGLAPLIALGGAWFVALFILWSGWKMFLPEATMPFIPISDGIAIFYFGVGRLLYFDAPVLIGWGIGIIAAHQRLKFIWPAVGLILMSLLSSMAHVHVSRLSAVGRGGQVSLGIGPGIPLYDGLIRSSVILLLSILPYVIWRLQRLRSARG